MTTFNPSTLGFDLSGPRLVFESHNADKLEYAEVWVKKLTPYMRDPKKWLHAWEPIGHQFQLWDRGEGYWDLKYDNGGRISSTKPVLINQQFTDCDDFCRIVENNKIWKEAHEKH